ncbi:hypothetical protein I8752_10695 [Nostocaceae cyanobacterium CENA369]|uniref:Uncharacterized protein n=1 Tax=Dendronalium phyllosphericum CENA369 TaxID=1725256 RepID=A0A8J7I2F3_9NOST|nr:hypothetical protein [Dendronalium phyllosphericum]MBH8573475.1 hypothetical protein [Dendronalium phyllosphericum CENA369]
MGGKPWHYFVPHCTDINSALQVLREQEFCAGRYGFGALEHFFGNLENFDRDYINSEESPEELIEEYGNVQAAIEAVLDEYGSEGTASILDMLGISLVPESSAVSPISRNDLLELFGTDKPTREMVESILIEEQDLDACEEFWSSISRGEGRYIVLYTENQPVEIFFAGYSFD